MQTSLLLLTERGNIIHEHHVLCSRRSHIVFLSECNTSPQVRNCDAEQKRWAFEPGFKASYAKIAIFFISLLENTS